jgi:hypothetical protein
VSLAERREHKTTLAACAAAKVPVLVAYVK